MLFRNDSLLGLRAGGSMATSYPIKERITIAAIATAKYLCFFLPIVT
jgi:hypothetical protein